MYRVRGILLLCVIFLSVKHTPKAQVPERDQGLVVVGSIPTLKVTGRSTVNVLSFLLLDSSDIVKWPVIP